MSALDVDINLSKIFEEIFQKKGKEFLNSHYKNLIFKPLKAKNLLDFDLKRFWETLVYKHFLGGYIS